ncbi:RidA family protein [Nonomuraea ceibae]|uniref:RidA family protein n=1 Tax=Nonomuraea ceibae TaxID=1935170 RepID=UPI001C5E42E8|nr:RidA family protein [Nonomuraea ceibae]
MINRWNPAGVPAPVGRYSHVAAVPGGTTLVFVSGQVGNLADGSLAGPDALSQTRQAFANLRSVLDACGAGPDDVVKLLTFVAGAGHLPGFRAARDEVFDAWYPGGDVPAHSLAVVAALADPALTVEIEAVVAVDGDLRAPGPGPGHLASS